MGFTLLDRIGLAALGFSLFCYFVTMLVFWIPKSAEWRSNAKDTAVNMQQIREDLEKCEEEQRELRLRIEWLMERLQSD